MALTTLEIITNQLRKAQIMRKHHLSKFRHLGGTLAAVAFVFAIAVSNASAATVYNYGDFVGSSVKYINVNEKPNSIMIPPGGMADESPLFDAPTLLGDTLDFNPLFSLFGSGGQVGVQDSLLRMDIMSVNNFEGIKTLTITEGGGYSVAGGSATTFAQQSLVFPLGEIYITAIDGVAVTPIAVPANIQYTFTPNVAPFITTSSNTIKFDASNGLNSGSWSAVATFDVEAAMANAGQSGNATRLELTLDNILGIQTDANGIAAIDKKDFKIITTVPEPTAVALALFGGLGVVAASYRRLKKAAC